MSKRRRWKNRHERLRIKYAQGRWKATALLLGFVELGFEDGQSVVYTRSPYQMAFSFTEGYNPWKAAVKWWEHAQKNANATEK
jgi:hypothetical protein